MPRPNPKALAATRVYLAMREFELLEQNWSLGPYKIDAIARKNDQIYFISITHHPSGQIIDEPKVSQTMLARRAHAAEAWLVETKWSGRHTFAALDLSGPSYSVIGFSDEAAN